MFSKRLYILLDIVVVIIAAVLLGFWYILVEALFIPLIYLLIVVSGTIHNSLFDCLFIDLPYTWEVTKNIIKEELKKW